MRYNSKIIILILTAAISLAAGCQSQQRTFSSPDEAVAALDAAVKAQDKAELQRIFGPQLEHLKSGDPEQDHDDVTVFARRLAEARKLRHDAPDRATLLVGEEQWPFAVPLIMKKSSWHFDTEAGLDELTNRRIGRNELRTIAACRTLIDAEREFFERDPDGLGIKHYAKQLMSSEGKKDGLYWPAPGGVEPSPIGPVMAMSASRRDDHGQRMPFNGYLFKVLYRQTASAPGGAKEFMENGQLTRGWAVIAYPAEYGETGIMSFLCSSGGVVYQQDLGDDTDTAVQKIDALDPGMGWQKLEAAEVAKS
jgi:hypothetical protein